MPPLRTRGLCDRGFKAPARAEDLDDTDRMRKTLAGGRLVTEHSPGRYGFHDLLRIHAGELSTEQDAVGDRAAAAERLFAWDVKHVNAAADMLYPDMVRLRGPADGATAFPDSAIAASWLRAEEHNIGARVRHAAEHGPPDAQLAMDDIDEAIVIATQAVTLHRECGHRLGQVRSLRSARRCPRPPQQFRPGRRDLQLDVPTQHVGDTPAG